MALQMTHLAVAFKVAEVLGIEDNRAEYILGSVAPDSVWFSDAYLEKKIHSHSFENCGPWGDTQDYDNWLLNIEAFWKKYVVSEKDTQTRIFLTGMCVHNLTDYWYDLMVWSALKRKMIPPMTFDEFKEKYYPEAQCLDKWLFKNFYGAKEILKLLRESKETDFEDFVTADNQVEMKRHLIGKQFNIEGIVDASSNKMFEVSMLSSFIDEATDKICEQIRNY